MAGLTQAPLPLVLVAAVARNGVIGRDGAMPWRLRGDLAHFRALTMGHPVVMGRKTFQSIGKALPGRANIVVTRDAGLAAPGATIVASIAEALAEAEARAPALGAHATMVAGGGEIYAATIGLAQRLEITEVDVDPEGDARFPAIDPARWRETARRPQLRGAGDDADYAFVTYERR